MTIDAGEPMNIINELSCNKSLGLDGLTEEHIKFADSQLVILLSILLSQKRKKNQIDAIERREDKVADY